MRPSFAAEPGRNPPDGGSPHRDQSTVIVIEDRYELIRILQDIRGTVCHEVRLNAIKQCHGMELGRTPTWVEDAIRLFRVTPECFGPSLGHRVTPGTDAAVGMCREPSQRRTRGEIDEMQRPGRLDDTQATLIQEILAHNVARRGRSQVLSERLEERTAWIGL